MTQQQQQQQAPPEAVIAQFRQLIQQSQSLVQKISELEMDRNEHKLVEETLAALKDPSRKAYRLVGEILVERTVQEVLPSIQTNRTHVRLCCAVLLRIRVHYFVLTHATLVAL